MLIKQQFHNWSRDDCSLFGWPGHAIPSLRYLLGIKLSYAWTTWLLHLHVSDGSDATCCLYGWLVAVVVCAFVLKKPSTNFHCISTMTKCFSVGSSSPFRFCLRLFWATTVKGHRTLLSAIFQLLKKRCHLFDFSHSSSTSINLSFADKVLQTYYH